jgi:MGT family glycosyltransferase
MPVAKTIVFTPASSVLAHVGRCVLVAKELQQRRHKIVFAGLPKYLDDRLVAGGSFEYYPLPDFEADEGLQILRRLSRIPSRQVLERHLAAELQMLDDLKPDLVVSDFRLTILISAAVKRVPTVSLLGGRWIFPYIAKPYRAFRTAPFYTQLRTLFGERATDRLVPLLLRLVLRYKVRPYAGLFKKHGLEPKRVLWDLIIGDLNLILDTERLAPTRTLPENFRRVGPIYWTLGQPLPDWVRELGHDQPLIYVTMGSTGDPALFAQLIALLGDQNCQVVLTTGGQIDLSLHDVPPNVHVAKYLPGEKVMAMADLVICHGGAGTVYQAIETGTPCIVITTHFEQEFLGAEIEEQGAGLFFSLHEVMARPRLVRDAIVKVLAESESFRGRMADLQQDLMSYNGKVAAADCIEQFLNTLDNSSTYLSAPSSGDWRTVEDCASFVHE